MKKMISRMSIQKQMMIYFAIPLLVVQILSSALCYPVFLHEFREQINYSLEQSVAQAMSFIENYIHNMEYLAEMVENNRQIYTILSSDEFLETKGMREQYMEFYLLNREFDSLEVSNSLYRFGLYVPDGIVYSNNNYHIFPESRLIRRDDFDRMEEMFAIGKNYIALSEERKNIGTLDNSRMLTLYHKIEMADNMDNILGVCSISIDENRIIQVIKNANITSNGLVYLIDDNGNGIVSSDSELYEELKEKDNFPLAGNEMAWDSMKIGSAVYYAERKNVGITGWQMVFLIPLSEYNGQYFFLLLAAAMAAITMMVMIVAVSYRLSGYYVGRLKKLTQEMQHLQGGDLNVQLPSSQQGDEIEEVYKSFNFMVNELRRMVREHYRLGKEVRAAEMRALRAQINPHFLYNTLDLINWIAADYGAEDIEKIVCNLAKFYRLSLNHGKDLISIREEIAHVQAYVNIEKFHYDTIQLETVIPESLKDLACLNIIFQPFAENAIVHGIGQNSKIKSCKIEIRAKQMDGDILFSIRDDGPGMTELQMEEAVSENLSRMKGGYGIKNINFRIKLCFGEKYGVRYESTLGEGTTAYILIPAMTMEEAKDVVM